MYIADFDLTYPLREFRASHTRQLYKEQPFGITWQKGLFLLFLNETLLASFRRLHHSPEFFFLSLDLFIFFLSWFSLFSFFMSYYRWANLSETD